MKKAVLMTVSFIGLILINGCASTGLTASSHQTQVQLGQPNFRMIAVNVSGEASSEAIFGVSYGFGIATSQVALIPLNQDRLIYKNATKSLWANFENEHGPVANRRLALVNVRYDSETINLFVYTRLSAVIIADIIEFD